MDLTDMIAQSQGGQGLENLGRQFNLTDEQTRAAVDELAPAIMAGLRRETRSPDGLSGLLAALADGDHGRYLEGDDSGIVDDGNAILGHVFGSKDVSRGVAAHAADMSGISAGILKQMLPVIAAMAMGALTRKMTGSSGTAGGLGDVLGQVLGGGARGTPGGAGGGLGDILGQVLGGRSSGGAGPAAGGGGIGDILGSIFGGQASPGSREEATKRVGDAMSGMLGGDTPRGNAADELLNSVDRAIRRQ